MGAHALAAAGRPRATQDLDILVEPTRGNSLRLGAALRAFGFDALAREAARFAEPNRMATLGRPPMRIDLMTSITGVSFRSAWKHRHRARFGTHGVAFLSPKQLVQNKRAAARPKDLADLALLAEVGVTG